MNISIIAALTKNHVIGKENRLPWRLPSDLKRFRKLTQGHPVIMGRKTWESLGRPLPDRLNIVISRNSELKLSEGVIHASSLEDAFREAQSPRSAHPGQCFVIGGEEIYRLALPHAHKLYLTWIELECDGDAFFPELPVGFFSEASRENFGRSGDEPAHSFVIYRKIRDSEKQAVSTKQ